MGTRNTLAIFWKGVRRGITMQDYNLVNIREEKVSPIVKFEIFLTVLCFLLYPLTNKHWRTWSSMINLWIDSDLSKVKNSAASKAKV